jgi:hypothetical protein
MRVVVTATADGSDHISKNTRLSAGEVDEMIGERDRIEAEFLDVPAAANETPGVTGVRPSWRSSAQ